MRNLAKLLDGVTIADKVTAMALPPPTFGAVPEWFASDTSGCVPQVELEVWADGAETLTNAQLYGAAPHLQTIADLVFTVVAGVHASLDLATKTTHCDTVIEDVVAGVPGNSITIAFVADGQGAGTLDESSFPAIVFHFADGVTTVANFEAKVALASRIRVKTPGTPAHVLTLAADVFAAANLTGGTDTKFAHNGHGLLTGDGPVRLSAGTSLPTALDDATDYWVVKRDTNNFALATSLFDALSGVVVEAENDGVGALTLSDTADTQRLHWHTRGLIGVLGDGAISVDGQASYSERRDHSPRVVAYAIVATFGGSGAHVSAAFYPIREV